MSHSEQDLEQLGEVILLTFVCLEGKEKKQMQILQAKLKAAGVKVDNLNKN